MKIVLMMVLGSLLGACATTDTANTTDLRTLYAPHNQSGGYSDGSLTNGILVSRFVGNAYTHKNYVEMFSQFRAVEICKEQGFEYVYPLHQEDVTTSRTTQRTLNYQNQAPALITGSANAHTNYNYYGGNTLYSSGNTNLNGIIIGGGAQGGSSSWEETHTYPALDFYFSCANNSSYYKIGITSKTLRGEEIKEYTKDKLGGVQVIGIGDDSPNKDLLQVGDIILKVDSNRVLNEIDLAKYVRNARSKTEIPFAIVREGKGKIVIAKTIDRARKLEEAQNQVISTACKVPEIESRPVCQQYRGISSIGK